MEEKLISVIIPIYNTREYLSRCVNSVLKQTHKNLEVILVDDGSADGSGELCDELGRQDERIRVIHKENGGSSSARNLGIAAAKGEFLGFVDSDDYVEEDMYEKLIGALEQYGADMAQVGRDEIDPSGNKLPDICVPPQQTECIAAEKFMEELLMHRGDCSFCTKLIRRSLLTDWQPREEGKYFPEGLLNEDFYLLVQILKKDTVLVSLPGYSYHVFYRVGSNSRKENKNLFSPVFADCVNNADMVEIIVKREYPALEKISFRFGIFQRLEYMLHIPVNQMKRENQMYRSIVRYLRKNWLKAMTNPILTRKNKIYHTLFAAAPATVRRIQKKLRG